jgi:hypothetical protein
MKASAVCATMFLLALIPLAGCGNPRDAVITKDNRYKAFDDAGPQLSEDERRELTEAHARSLFGKYSIEGKTVNQVLAEQKEFDDAKTAPLLGSWICSFTSHGRIDPHERVIFSFNANDTETVLFMGRQPQRRPERYHFGFDGTTLDEEGQWGFYLDSVNLSGPTLRIERATQKSGTAEGGTVMWPDVFTCRRARASAQHAVSERLGLD